MKRREAVLWALVLGLCVYEFGDSPAWAQFKEQVQALTITSASGLSGGGTSDSPLACTAASASAAGCVSTSAQTFAGNKTVLGPAGQAPDSKLLTVANPDGGTALATVDSEGDVALGSVTASYTGGCAFNSPDQGGQGFCSGNTGVRFGYNGGSNVGTIDHVGTVGALWLRGPAGTIASGVLRTGTLNAELASGDALAVTSGGYTRIKTVAGAPTAGDCDAAGEAGRLVVDTSTPKWCVCDGAAWKCVAVAP